MADLKKALPNTRAMTVLIVTFSLFAIFLLPYFFHYVPANKSTLHQQAFLKLSRAAQNIIDKQNDLKNALKYTNSRIDSISTSDLNIANCRNNTNDSVCFRFSSSGAWNIVYKKDTIPDKHWIMGKPISFDAYQFPLSDFIKPCLASAKELFESLSLLHYCDKAGKDSVSTLIYQDSPEMMERNLNIDTLVPRRQGLRSPDMIDITIGGINYKMFTWPFQIRGHRLILCGFLKTSIYNSRLNVMPVWIVYTLLIILLLFILSLPVLKVFMMNELDRVSVYNFKAGIFFLLTIATFITLVIIQLFLLYRGNLRIQENLRNLSGSLTDSLSAELTQINSQLNSLEQIRLKDRESTPLSEQVILNTLQKYHKQQKELYRLRMNCLDPFYARRADSLESAMDRDSLYSSCKRYVAVKLFADDSVFQKLKIKKNKLLFIDSSSYTFFDHASWINAAGQEMIRAYYIDVDSTDSRQKYKLVDVSRREYFTDFKTYISSDPFPDSLHLSIAPVYSWISNEFRVNVCRRTKWPEMLIEVLQTRLYSLVNTVLPLGYGFCLFGSNGEVLIHSDTMKSLRENFLDETNNLRWIREAINSRQTDSSGNVPFYDKRYALRIQPLPQHPLFLATFYDNSYQLPVNIRILAFALLFCSIVYAILLTLIIILYPRPLRSFLFAPADYISWLYPLKNFRNYYFNGTLLLSLYLFILAIAAILINRSFYDDFDYALLAVTIIIPVNVLFVLKLLRSSKKPVSYRGTLLKIAVPVAVSLVLYYATRQDPPFRFSSFICLEAVTILLMIGIAIKNGKYWYQVTDRIYSWKVARRLWKNSTTTNTTIFLYSCFVTIFIMAMAVFPVIVFSWFAVNHERRQLIKKEQLHMAESIHRRASYTNSFLRAYQPQSMIDQGLFNTIQYTKGIYPIYRNRIVYDNCLSRLPEEPGEHIPKSEPFYLGVANTLGVNYEDPSFLPALKDSMSNDNLYHWDGDPDSIIFDYSYAKWGIPPSSGSKLPDPAIKIRVITFLPADSDFILRWMIVLIVCVLSICIYWLVIRLAKRLFFPKIIDGIGEFMHSGKGEDAGIWKRCWDRSSSVTSVREAVSGVDSILPLLEKEYDDFKVFISSTAIEREMEFTIRAEQLKPLFDCAWRDCSAREKFMLYGLAIDGLINHKNDPLIYKLFRNRLIRVDQERIKLISYSFRYYILLKKGTKEEAKLLAMMHSAGSWAAMRTIFIVVILSVLFFLFFTQTEVSGKIIAVITGFTTIIPLLFKFTSFKNDNTEK